MGAVNVVLGVVTALATAVAVALVARTVARVVAIIRLGQADGSRTGPFGPRFRTMVVESLGHTRMLKWSHVGVFHWLVMVGFGGLFLALVEAYGEVWNPRFHLPSIGEWGPYSLVVELLGLGTVVGIAVLAAYRQVADPRRAGGVSGRRLTLSWGSTPQRSTAKIHRWSDGARPARKWLGVRVDAIAEWSRAQQRVIELVADLPPERAALRVPACPDWTVRDLLSHMVGLGVDVVAGDEPDDHNEAWTGKHVTERRDRDVAALVAEWQAVAEPLRAWMRANNVRPLGDVIIHEQDLRGALGVPGGQDTEGIRAIRERFVGRFTPRVADLPPIALVGETWSWASRGSVDDAEVVLRAPDFELARALVTRRSAAQLHAWTSRGDVTPYLDAFAMLGPLPSVDLTESGSRS